MKDLNPVGSVTRKGWSRDETDDPHARLSINGPWGKSPDWQIVTDSGNLASPVPQEVDGLAKAKKIAGEFRLLATINHACGEEVFDSYKELKNYILNVTPSYDKGRAKAFCERVGIEAITLCRIAAFTNDYSFAISMSEWNMTNGY